MKLIGLILISNFAFAASAGEQGSVPAVVFHQAFNVTLLFLLLTFLLRKKVKAYFADKKANYVKASTEVAELKRQVELQAATLREKIRQLDETAEQSQKKAEVDAQEYNQKLLNEAREQAEKLRKETEKTIQAEVYRAVDALRGEIIDQSISNSRNIIRQQIKDSDQKRLQSEFVEKVKENGVIA